MENPTETMVPAAAGWLGALGMVPFVAAAAGAIMLHGTMKDEAAIVLLTYGATILSFLGGIHWGLAIGSAGRTTSAPHLILSVIPSLCAWAALLMPVRSGLLILAAAIALMLWVDVRTARAGEAPAWYPRLRWPLSCAVTAALLVGAL